MLTETPPQAPSPASPGRAPDGLWQRAGGVSGVLLAAIMVSLLRVIQLLLMQWMAPDGTLAARLLIWDGGWFINVAVEGYPDGYTYNAEGTRVGNGFAFFPLFPGLIRFFNLLGVPPQAASLSVATLAGIVAGVGIYLLGTALWSRRVGYALAVLVCAQPMSVVLTMGYTEPLFLALVVLTLLAAHRRAWALAGVGGVAAALTRPTGMAVAIALAVAVLLAWRTSTGRERAAGVTGAGLALLATPAFLAWVGWRVGEWDAWFKVQTAGWGSTFDYGSSVSTFLLNTLRGGTGVVEMVTAWMIIGAVALVAVASTQRLWPPLLVFGVISLVLVVGQAGYWHSKPRLLVPVLLVACVPLARALGTASTRTAAVILALWAAFGLWFGSHMITVWPFTI
ncbi:MAG TPA: hypothetical protein VF062_06580 [Candidatus Limnocylindrales bacterium]